DEEDDGIRALVDHLIDLGVLLDRVQVRIHDGDLLAVTGKRRLLALHVEELSQHLDVDRGRDRDGLVGERRTRSGTSGHERPRARHLWDAAGENQATPGQAGRLDELLTAETLMLEWSLHLRRFLSLSRQNERCGGEASGGAVTELPVERDRFGKLPSHWLTDGRRGSAGGMRSSGSPSFPPQ